MKKKLFSSILILVLLIGLLPTYTLEVSAKAGASKLPLAGKTISVMGDSISTYTGWSDAEPITDETCTYRYGEAYYGPEGGDFHNTDLLVTDTWWHQAATELGAKILMSNAGNSTGLLCASYPYDAGWDQYLKEMLAYKSRPYYLGKGGKTPDIIALYIGSNELARATVSQYGSVDDVDFDKLIKANSDGTYTYETPVTVAEAYCILLHKISVTYPEAEVYCFTVVPNAGGNLKVVNKRLATAPAFNAMIKGVAKHYDAYIVDIFDEFALDPDNDGVATQADYDQFATYFNNDPHPNAAGFDVITKRFVETVTKNSKYIVQVETTAGVDESVGIDVVDQNGERTGSASKYVTENGMLVDYNSSLKTNGKESTFKDSYTSQNEEGTYYAEGGKEKTVEKVAPKATVQLPVFTRAQSSQPKSDSAKGREAGVLSTTGDKKEPVDVGEYDYTQKSVVEQGSVSITAKPIQLYQRLTNRDYRNLYYTRGTVIPNDDNGLKADRYKELVVPESSAIKDSYEYVFIGSNVYSKYSAAFAYKKPTADMPDETPSYQDDKRTFYVGAAHSRFTNSKYNLLVSNMFLEDETIKSEDTGSKFLARWSDVQQFVLADRSGKTLTAYCADQNTGAHTGFNYNLYNLEDATYYTNAEARKIRAIAEHAYWGTKEGIGSLAAIKEELKAKGIMTDAELARFTDGMAMTATQYAIWTYSNVMDEVAFFNAYAKTTYPAQEADQSEVELIFKFYRYLVKLEPKATLEMKSTQKMVINESNFLEKVTISVKDKPADHQDNLDDNDKNDAYLVDISFKLGVKPNDGDSLVMRIACGEEAVATGRIAGTPADETETILKADDNDVFTFENIVINEGEDKFRFYLKGDQRLEKAAQLFLSEEAEVDGEMTYSQPLVSLMSGTREVGVMMDINFDLVVDDELLSTEHVWRVEKDINGGKEIPKVPLTGPNDFIITMMAIMSVCTVAAFIAMWLRRTTK